MNPGKAEKWLSMSMDGELSPRRRARLEAYLAVHPEHAAVRQDWERIGGALRDGRIEPARTPEAAWQDVRRALRVQAADASPVRAPAIGRRMQWAGAAAVLLLLAAGAWLAVRMPGPATGPVAAADRTEVEWVETELPGAISMVYEDAGTGLTVIWVMVSDNGEEGRDAG